MDWIGFFILLILGGSALYYVAVLLFGSSWGLCNEEVIQIIVFFFIGADLLVGAFNYYPLSD